MFVSSLNKSFNSHKKWGNTQPNRALPQFRHNLTIFIIAGFIIDRTCFPHSKSVDTQSFYGNLFQCEWHICIVWVQCKSIHVNRHNHSGDQMMKYHKTSDIYDKMSVCLPLLSRQWNKWRLKIYGNIIQK